MNIFVELFLTFAKIGGFTFGGGYAMISLLDYECVEKRNWITSEELMDVTVIAESTPGPIAINCATYTGYRQGGIFGAIVATLGIMFPSFLIILFISTFFEQMLTYPVVIRAFKGIRIAVSLLIIQAGIKMVKKMLRKTPHKIISIGFIMVSFTILLLLNFFNIRFSTIYLIIIAGLLGFSIYSLPKYKGGKK
ncbi:MAG: chromate transporter [Clostridiales bacterium]|nr:chromate transporter [Clostridiales bacterium]